MHKVALALMLGLTAAAPAPAERFAISCSGKRVSAVQSAGIPGEPKSSSIKGVIFVIDEDARTVEQRLPGENKFEDVCLRGVTCTRTFSEGRITVAGSMSQDTTGERPMQIRRTSSFDWDRKTNQVETLTDLHSSKGVGLMVRWSLKCVPTAIPATGS